tara:strand:- start:1430 stop:1660 length:231 start_codon:yes stop_codon:yes gene_type:complete
MKISEAKEKFETNYFSLVEIRKNPANISEYIALLFGQDGKSFMLCYENDTVLCSRELEHLILMLKEVGFSRAKIYF